MNASEWVEAENFPTPIDAQVAKARLEAHGIAAAVFDAELANSWVYTNALGGVRLMVAPQDLEAARKVLAENDPVEASVVADDEVISDDASFCPRCHSKDVEIESAGRSPSGWLGGLMTGLFGPRRMLRCRNCGHAWSG